jgi:hypothetical protein
MVTEASSRAIQPPPNMVRPPALLSPRMRAFLFGWFFGWPLAVYAYNPLTAPHEPLTLLLIVPGGAIWLLSFSIGCIALITMAEARWPVTKTILEIIKVIIIVLWNILWCIP